ncbi:hypothetical protein BH10ACT1_BH10ACT1_25410 [soil metagenome]
MARPVAGEGWDGAGPGDRLTEQRDRAILGLRVDLRALPVDPKLRAARSVALGALATEILVLLLSGVYLYFEYRPSPAQGFGEAASSAWRLADDVRRLHRWTGILAFGTSVVAGVLLVAERGLVGWHRLAEAVALPILAVGALVTGVLLPWDQAALWGVTVGTDLDGYDILTDDRVRFLLVGGSEVSVGALLSLLAGHGLVSVGLAIGLLVAWRRHHGTVASDPPVSSGQPRP